MPTLPGPSRSGEPRVRYTFPTTVVTEHRDGDGDGDVLASVSEPFQALATSC